MVICCVPERWQRAWDKSALLFQFWFLSSHEGPSGAAGPHIMPLRLRESNEGIWVVWWDVLEYKKGMDQGLLRVLWSKNGGQTTTRARETEKGRDRRVQRPTKGNQPSINRASTVHRPLNWQSRGSNSLCIAIVGTSIELKLVYSDSAQNAPTPCPWRGNESPGTSWVYIESGCRGSRPPYGPVAYVGIGLDLRVTIEPGWSGPPVSTDSTTNKTPPPPHTHPTKAPPAASPRWVRCRPNIRGQAVR